MEKIKEIALTAMRSLELGMSNEAGRVCSAGTCLYACYVLRMMLYTLPEQVVCDAFSGSGTTAVAKKAKEIAIKHHRLLIEEVGVETNIAMKAAKQRW